jgi:hypothetical protein
VTLPDASPAALYEFLDRLKAAGAPLVSVTPTRPDLEEIFIRLIHNGSSAGAMASEATV